MSRAEAISPNAGVRGAQCPDGAVEQLFAEMDRQLLMGEEPRQLLRFSCGRIAELFGYPLVVLETRLADGRRGMTVTAGPYAARAGAHVLSEGCPDCGVPVVLPVRVEGRLHAALHLFDGTGEGFSSAELAAVALIASRIGVLLIVCTNQQQLRLQGAALANAANAVFITNRSGEILWVNQAFTTMSGYSPEEAIGRNPRLLKSGAHDNQFFDRMWNTLSAGQPWDAEVVERHKDGSRYVVHQRITPIVGRDGQITHFVAIHEDLTERHRLEVELRTARDRALEAARLQAEFLANMSHEVRTPMNGVVGMLELLADTELTREQRHYLEVARRSARTLLDSLSEILDYSHLEAAALRLSPTDVDLYELLDEVVELMAGIAGEKGLELYYVVAPSVPDWVRVDRVRVRQVLSNLVGNALKFTSRGEVVIRVACEREGGPLLRFCVHDTGIGISPEAQSRIFSPFQQADGSTARRFGGTGLGLAISRHLVGHMGGTIGVESEPGIGSNFWFTVAVQELAGVRRAPTAPYSGRVLVAESRQGLRTACLGLIKALGIGAEAAEDGTTTLALLEEAAARGRPFGLLLLADWLPDAEPEAIVAAARVIGCEVAPMAAPGRRTGACSGEMHCLHRPLSRAQLSGYLQALSAAPGPASRRAARATHLGDGRVLVVEDNPVNRQVAIAMLNRLGVACDVVEDGRDALARLEDGDYRLVLMDCQLPGMDGYEVAGLVRRRERQHGLARTPIVAITANAREDEAERCAAADMDGYLAKPLDVGRLQRVLERYLERAPVEPIKVVPETAEGVLDRNALAQLREVDAEDAASIVDAFLADTPPRLKRLATLVETADWKAGERLAHTLKGSSAALGVIDLSKACKELEIALRAANGAQADEQLSEASSAFERARPALIEFRDRINPVGRVAGGRS